MTTKDILKVKKLIKDGCEYIACCPHCGKMVGLDGELKEIKGEQYHHSGYFGCDGWFEVSNSSTQVINQEQSKGV